MFGEVGPVEVLEGAGEDDGFVCKWGVDCLVWVAVVFAGEVDAAVGEAGEGVGGGFGFEVVEDGGGGVCAEACFVGGFEFVFGAGELLAFGLAHGVDGGGHELPKFGVAEVVDVFELAGEEFGGGGADVADAHACEDSGEALVFGGFDPGEEIVYFFVRHAIEADELVAVVFEIEDVGEVVERNFGIVGGSNEVDGGFAEAFDVHLLSACEPDEFLADLGGTFWVHAAAGGFEGWIVVGFGRVYF